MSKIENKPGIIVAFDMKDRMDAIGLADELESAKGNFAIKVGRPLEMKYGIGIISAIQNITDIPIIYDGKIADIPYISAMIAETAYDYGASAVITHSFVGLDVVQAIVDLDKGDVIAVVEMSHPGWGANKYPFSMTLSLSEIGVNGIVLPATKPELIRSINNGLEDDMYIISPGVGVQGASIGDAIEAGATYEILGRLIYDSDDPAVIAEYYYNVACTGNSVIQNF